jgi:methylmalonyl-CoA mutase C-terminal domain/subunit
MARADEIVAVAQQEDVDIIGLNVGGRMEVVERIVEAVRAAMPGLPIIAGGTLAPPALRRLNELGISGFPPGSSLRDIVAEAQRLTATAPMGQGRKERHAQR